MQITPMMQQYHEIKNTYQDSLLFFRLGDFYEMFGEDALTGSRELDIALTARSAGEQGKIPMCGVPYHAAETYISRLIAKGYKVAICEQMEDPKNTKTLVKRDVVRIITPGTLVDDSLIKDSAANYLAAVAHDAKEYAIAYSDISTGEFAVTQISGEDAWQKISGELSRLNPAEILLPKDLYEQDFFRLRAWDINSTTTLTLLPDELFIRRNAATLLLTQFELSSLASLGLSEMKAATLAAASLLYFAQQTQKRSLNHLGRPQLYNLEQFMVLDSNTRRNLEITNGMRQNKNSSLLYVCNKTKTAMGSRLLRQWLEKPPLDSQVANLRLDAIGSLLNHPLEHEKIRAILEEIHDLERLAGRVSYGNISPRDLMGLALSSEKLPAMKPLLAEMSDALFGQLFEAFDTLDDVCAPIKEALVEEPPLSPREGGLIKDGYDKDIDELRTLTSKGKDWVLSLEEQEKAVTGIKSLKVGFNKVFGYYIEVTKTNLALVPSHYIRKQTLAGAERYITEELKEWENKILGAGERLERLEYAIFEKLREQTALHLRRIQKTASILAHIDVLQALALVAKQNNYCKPQVNDGNVIAIKEGRHPIVEKSLGWENYVPNDCLLDNRENNFALITGPNMSGKSTYMRQVALCAILARAGSFVPAQEAMFGRIDRIFTRVGASDDLSAGQSTFMVEMCETANILNNATASSLIILDEIGRGTSTYDGLSIAWAVSEYILNQIGAKTLFATHYHELIALAESFKQVKNYSVAVQEKGEKITFLHKIVAGGTDKSYGLHVAALAGLPDKAIQRAAQILGTLSSTEKVIRIPEAALATPVKQPQEQDSLTQELLSLNINSLTPMEALLYIEKWQKEVKNT